MAVAAFWMALGISAQMVFATPVCTDCKDDELILNIIHLNDFHARYEETNWDSGVCGNNTDKCVGGIARITTKINEILSEKPDSIVLNAGDNFQGSFYYNFYRWNITAHFMNKLPFNAFTIGNHEFDNGVDGLVPFLQNLKFPVVVSNMDVSEEPSLEGLFNKSIIIERNGYKIGIIGYILKTTNEISSSGKVKFEDEITAVRSEALLLKDQGVNIIIGLSHAGIDVDVRVAEEVENIDIIVGGHSHTLLYTGTPPGGDVALDNYPLVINQRSGRKVLIVQAGAFSKYLGNLSVTFDENGEVLYGEGNPILLDSSVEQDSTILEDLEFWREPLHEMLNQPVGSTKVFLNATNWACAAGECNLGSFLTDAMVHEFVSNAIEGHWTEAAIAFMNSGGIRASIDETSNGGVISYNDMMSVAPFENTIDLVDLSGADMIAVLEQAVSREYKMKISKEFSGQGFLQMSGIQVLFDINLPVGGRVVRALARCAACRVPKYENINLEQMYRIAIPSFLYGGGDGYTIFKERGLNHTVGRIDNNIFLDYFSKRNPVTQEITGRIQIIQKEI